MNIAGSEIPVIRVPPRISRTTSTGISSGAWQRHSGPARGGLCFQSLAVLGNYNGEDYIATCHPNGRIVSG